MNRRRWIVLIIVTHVALLLVGSAIHAPTIDEPVHLHAGLKMIRHGHAGYNLGNPPMVDVLAAVPVMVVFPSFDLRGERYLSPDSVPYHRSSLMSVFWVGRLMLIPFSLIGAACVFYWSGQLYGRGADMLALTLWCFNPCLLAFGQQITGDLAATSLGVFAMFSFWTWLKEPCWTDAIGAGLATGLALCSKMVWVVAFGLLPLIWIFWLIVTRKTTMSSGRLQQATQLGCCMLLMLVIINAGYGFEAVLKPLSAYRPMLQAAFNLQIPEQIESLPIPLPYNYIRGIVDVRNVLAFPERSYLGGVWKEGGWWYYYLYGMATKIPLGTWGLIAVSIGLSIGNRVNRSNEILMLIPGLAMLAFISWTTRNMSTQYRYILPVYPFFIIYASQSGRYLASGAGKIRGLIWAFMLWTVTSSLLAFPHCMGYFNEAAGGSNAGSRHFLGSSLHWGEDLFMLKMWKDRHCPEQPIWLAYRTALYPGLLGIDFRPLPVDSIPPPGWYAVEVSLLSGKPIVSWRNEQELFRIDPSICQFLRNRVPDDRIGNSILLFHLSNTEADQVKP